MPHPGSTTPLFGGAPGFEPSVISVKANRPTEYKKGLSHPIGGLPVAMSLSFKSEIVLAIAGHDALVPLMNPVVSFTVIANATPAAEMSGNPRPETLKRPAFVLPRALRY